MAGTRAGSAEGGEVGDTGTLELAAGAGANAAEGNEVGGLGGRTTRKRMKLNTQVTVADRFRTAKRCTTQHGRAGTPIRKHEMACKQSKRRTNRNHTQRAAHRPRHAQTHDTYDAH